MSYPVAYQISLALIGEAPTAYDVMIIEGKPHAVIETVPGGLRAVHLDESKIEDLQETDFHDRMTCRYRGVVSLDQAKDFRI